MDIIHELSLIINIIEEQHAFTYMQGKRLNFSFGNLQSQGSFREQAVSSINRFKALRDRAGIAKSSTESLLDIKMKQENLEQATNIRKLADQADQRARESERAQTMLFVFTMVTIIFTPLSFVAAFFAIPSREFPLDGDDISWSKAQIGWGLAGTPVGISEIATLILVGMLSGSLMTSSNMFSWISWQRLRGGRQGDVERN
ncbi:unnamed protein product [Clonostachys rosea]|uniref:Uncharacterized protein n=1 Tax=Bionectria ochroleuca TaxID=29856 RepID=A0ABY6UK41_BIOOC|nr:unnamed protein product [Clonostachys rosea]